MLDNRLETLLTVAETCSFTRAAEKLSLTQPAVSHQIGQLEKELGATLFRRRKNGLMLTKEGEIVLDYAYRMYALYFSLKRSLHDEMLQKKRLSIGITQTLDDPVTEQAVTAFSLKHPEYFLAMQKGTANNLYHQLESGEMDMLIVDHHPTLDDVSAILLNTDPIVCVMAPDHPLAAQETVSVDSFIAEPLVLPMPLPGKENILSTIAAQFNHTLDECNIILESNSFDSLKRLLKTHPFVSVLPLSAVQEEVDNGALRAIPIDGLERKREINLVTRKDNDDLTLVNELAALYEEQKQK